MTEARVLVIIGTAYPCKTPIVALVVSVVIRSNLQNTEFVMAVCATGWLWRCQQNLRINFAGCCICEKVLWYSSKGRVCRQIREQGEVCGSDVVCKCRANVSMPGSADKCVDREEPSSRRSQLLQAYLDLHILILAKSVWLYREQTPCLRRAPRSQPQGS